MNKHFTLIWNTSCGQWQTAGELAKTAGKRSAKPSRPVAVLNKAFSWRRSALATAIISSLFISPQLAALPQGGQVVNPGDASTIEQIDLQTTITQAEQNSIYQWDSFNIDAGETVQFVQPNAQASALNRITDANPSQILGSLQANGRVFLVNSNGVLFGQGAEVSAEAIIASSLDINNADFMAGNYVFEGSNGQAKIQLDEGSRLNAKTIGLLGATISNNGILSTQVSASDDVGNIVLAGGSKITLSFADNGLMDLEINKADYDTLVENKQLIEVIGEGGARVLLQAGTVDTLAAAAVNNTGEIQARGLAEVDGDIVLLAEGENSTGLVDGKIFGNGEADGIKTKAMNLIVADTAEVFATKSWEIESSQITTDYLYTSNISGEALRTTAKYFDNGNTDFELSLIARDKTDSVITIDSVLQFHMRNTSKITVHLKSRNEVNINDSITFSALTLDSPLHAGITINTGLSYDESTGDWSKSLDHGYNIEEFRQSTLLQYTREFAGLSFHNADALYSLDNIKFQVINGRNSNIGLSSIGLFDKESVYSELQSIHNFDGNRFFAIQMPYAQDWKTFGDIAQPAQGYFDGLGDVLYQWGVVGTDNVGIFGVVGSGSTLSNFQVHEPSITGNNNIGVIAGQAIDTVIKGINIFSPVVSSASNGDSIGGLVGNGVNLKIYDVNITNDREESIPEIKGGNFVGGLVGHGTNLEINNTFITIASITGNEHTGGFVGSANVVKIVDSSLSNLYQPSLLFSISGGNSTGGLIGSANNLILNRVSVQNVDISGINKVGGLIGDVTTASLSSSTVLDLTITGNDYLGGMIGSGSNVNISQSQSESTLVDGSNYLGGMVGFGDVTTISNSEVIGIQFERPNIIGRDYLGGIIGHGQEAKLTNVTTSANIITGHNFVGGLIGAGDGSIIKYSAADDSSASGVENIGGLIGSGAGSVISESFTNGSITGAISVGGIIGDGAGSLLTNVMSIGRFYLPSKNYQNEFSKLGGILGNGIDAHTSKSYAVNYSDSEIINFSQISGTDTNNPIDTYWTDRNPRFRTDLNHYGIEVSSQDMKLKESFNAGLEFSSECGLTQPWCIQDGQTLPGINAVYQKKDTRISPSYHSSIYNGGNTYIATLRNYYGTSYDQEADRGLQTTVFLVFNKDKVNAGTYNFAEGDYQPEIFSSRYNFNIIYTPQSYTVIPRDVYITRIVKTYDGSNTLSLDVFNTEAARYIVEGDDVFFSYESSDFDRVKPTYEPETGWVGEYSTVLTGANLTGKDAANYKLKLFDSRIDVTVLRKPIYLDQDNFSKTYDGTTHFDKALFSSSILDGDDAVISAESALFSIANAGANNTLFLSGLSVSGEDSSNYLFLDSTRHIAAEITPRTLTIESSAPDKTYNGSNTANVELLPTNLVEGDDLKIEFLNATFSGSQAGNNKKITVTGIELGGGDSENYIVNSSSIEISADILPKPIILHLGFKTYDGTNDVPSHMLHSPIENHLIQGDEVAFNYDNAYYEDKNTSFIGDEVVLKQIHIAGAKLTGKDANNYEFISANSYVTPKDINISQAVTKFYDGSVGINSLSPKFFESDNVQLTFESGYFDSADAGENIPVTLTGLALSGSDAFNYSISAADIETTGSIIPRPLEIEVVGINKVYDGLSTARVEAIATNLIEEDEVYLTAIDPQFIDKVVGENKIVWFEYLTLNGQAKNNYQIVDYYSQTQADISAKDISITISVDNKIYDGTSQASLILDFNDMITGDDLGADYAEASFSDKNVGQDKPVTIDGLTLTGDDRLNYNVVPNEVAPTANITPLQLQFNASGSDRAYDGTTATDAQLTISGFIENDDITADFSDIRFVDKNVGEDKTVTMASAQLNGDDASNYQLPELLASSDISVTPKDLAFSVIANSKVYDGGTAAGVSVTTTDVIAGDAVSYSYTNAAFGNKNVGESRSVGVEGLSLSGTDANNYRLVNTNAFTTADIIVKDLSLELNTSNKTYDGNTNAQVNLSSSAVASGEDVSFTFDSAVFDNKNAGEGKTITISGASISGNDAANYQLLDSTIQTTADILQRALLVQYTATDKIYDANVDASVQITSTGLVLGDQVSLAVESASFNDKNVGQDKLVSINNILLEGADAANYAIQIDAAEATASILSKQVEIFANALNKSYDGNNNAQVSFDAQGLLAEDDVQLNGGQAQFSDANAGDNKAITLSDFNLSGADAGNYQLTASVQNLNANITPAELQVRANDDVQTEGNSYSGGNGFSASGFVNGEDTNILQGNLIYGGSAQGANQAGLYTISANGFNSANYQIDYQDGQLLLEPLIAQNNDALDGARDIPATNTSLPQLAQQADLLSFGFSAAGGDAQGEVEHFEGKLVIIQGGLRQPDEEELLEDFTSSDQPPSSAP